MFYQTERFKLSSAPLKALTGIEERSTNVRYFWLDDTARLVERTDNKMPTEVVGGVSTG
jgi:hypothetical protein